MSPHYLKIYWLLIASREGKSVFLRFGTYASIGNPMSVHVIAELSGLCVFTKKKIGRTHESGRGEQWW